MFSIAPSEKSSTIVKENVAQTKPPLDEINKITDVLETLINKHKMTDMGNENLLKTDEVKEDIKREVNSYADIFAAAKNLVEKVEIANNFLLHIERAGNTLNEDTENKNSGDFITENSSDDVSETIDTDEVEKDSEENSVENISENFQNMENLTEKNEENNFLLHMERAGNTLTEDTENKNSGDVITENSSDDVSENIDSDEVETSRNTENFDDFHENSTKTSEDTRNKNSEDGITENTVENISKNFQSMENLTEKNEEKSTSTVPQIDKKILRKRSFIDYKLVKSKTPMKMKYSCLACKNRPDAPVIVETPDKSAMKRHLMRRHGVDKFGIDKLFSKNNPKVIELL